MNYKKILGRIFLVREKHSTSSSGLSPAVGGVAKNGKFGIAPHTEPLSPKGIGIYTIRIRPKGAALCQPSLDDSRPIRHRSAGIGQRWPLVTRA